MTMIKNKLFLTASALCLLSAAMPANAGMLVSAQDMKAPGSILMVSDSKAASAEAFVSAMAQRGIDFLANPDASLEQRKSEFRSLLRDSFDMKTIGRFALGRYWGQATDAQKQEYLTSFEKMIIDVYSKRFGDYQGQDFKVVGSRAEGDNDSIVTSHIIPKNGEKITVDWRIRNKGGSNKVVDVIVEGVSMATTQRSEFASVIQRGGGNLSVLLDHLRQ